MYPRRVFVDNEISIKTLGFRRLDSLLSLHQTTYTTNTTISFSFFFLVSYFLIFLCPLPCLVLGFISASPYHEQTISLQRISFPHLSLSSHIQKSLSPLSKGGLILGQNIFSIPLYSFLLQASAFAHSRLVAPSSFSKHSSKLRQDAACSRSPRAHLDCHASHGVYLAHYHYWFDLQLHW